jgi:hypothetical protein
MTLSPMEPNVSNITCLKHRDIRSAGCTRSAQAQRIEEVLFGLKIKRAGKIIVSTVWIHPYEQINGWWEITDSRVAPRIAQIDSAHIV